MPRSYCLDKLVSWMSSGIDPAEMSDFRSIGGLEIISDTQTHRESTYCQALLYAQRLQKMIVKKYLDSKEIFGPKIVGCHFQFKLVFEYRQFSLLSSGGYHT